MRRIGKSCVIIFRFAKMLYIKEEQDIRKVNEADLIVVKGIDDKFYHAYQRLQKLPFHLQNKIQSCISLFDI